MSVLRLQLPGALVRPLVVIRPNLLHDFLQIRLFALREETSQTFYAQAKPNVLVKVFSKGNISM